MLPVPVPVPVPVMESKSVLGSDVIRIPTREVHVLLVDDDTNVRKLIELLLREEGYKLTVCKNGREALQLFEARHAELTLGIVDMIMPGLSGLELIKAIRQVDPKFPVIIISGYSDREVTPEIAATAPTLFLQKPFQIDQLTKAISKLFRSIAEPGV